MNVSQIERYDYYGGHAYLSQCKLSPPIQRVRRFQYANLRHPQQYYPQKDAAAFPPRTSARGYLAEQHIEV